MKRIIQNMAMAAAVGAVLILVSTGCGRDNVKVYHVETSDSATPPPATAMPPAMPGGLSAPDNSGLPKLKYTLPDGWKEKPPTQMRVASFEISDGGRQADVSVIPMGGMAGGNLANVVRWRGQVGLEPVDEDAVQKMTEKVVIAGQDADLFDIAGTGPGSGAGQRIIASVLHRDDTAWFFKMTGDADLVEKQKAAFVSFLKSVQFGGAAAPAAMDLSQLPPSHPAIPGMNAGDATTPAPDAGNVPTWTVPAGWQPAPLTQFLLAKFSIAGAGDAQAAVNVSSLADDGGGLLANVNRWRQTQLGLDAVDQSGLGKLVSTFDANGSHASLVDFTGTDSKTGKPARLIGVVLPLGGQTWFYKLMGDPDVVAQQKEAFTKFVQSAKYPDAH